MVGDDITLVLGNLGLLSFDDFIDEFFDLATADTDDMVVVAFPVELEHGLPAFEMMTGHQSGGFKLGQYAIDRREADFFAIVAQRLVDILSTLMPDRRGFHQVENFHPRQGNLETRFFQIAGFHISLPTQSELVSGDILTLMRIISLMVLKNIFIAGFKYAALAGLIAMHSACSWLPQPHKLDIEQGNAITQDEFESLYTGMSQAEVLEAVGCPHDQRTHFMPIDGIIYTA